MGKTDIFNKIVDLLRERPDYASTLRTIVVYEKEHHRDQYFKTLGWQWSDLRVQPATLKQLFLMGMLNQVYKSRSRIGYLLADREDVERALEFAKVEQKQIVEEPFEVPEDLFDDVVGYEGVKKLFRKGLQNRVHFLMVGPPASAKSLFLLCLERLPRAKYVLGSRTSKAGLTDYLTTYKPTVLLVDELDKMRGEDMAVLLSLCESGRVPVTLYRKITDATLETIVFACANTLKQVPQEVQSRFQTLKFKGYSRLQFIQIVENVLARRGFDNKLALYIAEQVWDVLENQDPREALRLAKLAKSKAEVDEVIRILQKHL